MSSSLAGWRSCSGALGWSACWNFLSWACLYVATKDRRVRGPEVGITTNQGHRRDCPTLGDGAEVFVSLVYAIVEMWTRFRAAFEFLWVAGGQRPAPLVIAAPVLRLCALQLPILIRTLLRTRGCISAIIWLISATCAPFSLF